MNKTAFEPSRFLEAQHTVYAEVLQQLSAGQKRSHWMWFVFPQLAALGRSSTARFYGLEGVPDAHAFHQHPVLGARLRECCALVLGVHGRTAHQIFGSPDDLKLRSCMTLFNVAVPEEAVYDAVLQHFYKGGPDEMTLRLLHSLD
jgi:uncharacterized protein (DUF1810 family)